MKKKLKISIITVSLNSEHKIEKTIKSVINQNYIKNKIEHIIIDGKSVDKTIKILKKYKSKIFYYESKKDKGIYDAINKGIKIATGDIIGILNSDDFYYPETFNIINQYFNKYKIDYLFGSVDHLKIYHGFYPKKIWYKLNVVPSHSVSFFIKKESQLKIGLYDIKFKFSSDRDLFYRLIKSNLKGMATKKEEIFGKFAVDGLSSRLSYFTKLKEEFNIRLNNKQNIFLLFFLFSAIIVHKLIMTFFNKR
jgi:glycosyltransferase involved in cell wall biosynthesis